MFLININVFFLDKKKNNCFKKIKRLVSFLNIKFFKKQFNSKKKHIYVFNKSPHIYNKSKEHFKWEYKKNNSSVIIYNKLILFYFLYLINLIFDNNYLLYIKVEKIK